MKNGGEGGIRTLARFYPPNPLAGGPLWPLGYLARLCKLWDKKAWVYHSWCKKLLIDVVFCSICFRNIWKGTSIPLRIPLAEFGHIFVRLKSTPAGGHCVRTLNYVHNAPKPVGIVASYATMHLVQRVWFTPLVGQAGIEPATRGFSVHCCYLLSYWPIYKTQMKYLLELNQRQIV